MGVGSNKYTSSTGMLYGYVFYAMTGYGIIPICCFETICQIVDISICLDSGWEGGTWA
jgi:hypothetical protein